MHGTLYVVATPIGNSEDITFRARRILDEADIIAAEDTRTTQKLLRMLGIRNKLVSNHKFNEKRQVNFLIEQLLDGKNVAVVSDAGTPCISDPGSFIVGAAVSGGIDVVGISGASATITALSVSGFNFTTFAFYGFWPREDKDARKTIQRMIDSDMNTFIFFESPKRIFNALRLLAAQLPSCELCVCNDMTKMYERVYRGSPSIVYEELEANPNFDKGEYTIVIHVTDRQKEPEPDKRISLEALLIDKAVRTGDTIKRSIVSLQEEYRGKISKRELYNAALHLKLLMPRLFPSTVEDEDEGQDNESTTP
ncbi:MAG: 16S rRNA (cytidine(1402)-2'-O)-methyltransferase [Clostridiales bacterium]|nr:16S rRNA (cytidine(1402)-2'-O)-methyltransferase [Clostridiales bacterium]